MRRMIWLIFLGVFVVTVSSPPLSPPTAAAQLIPAEIIAADVDGIEHFALYKHGLYWWNGGECVIPKLIDQAAGPEPEIRPGGIQLHIKAKPHPIFTSFTSVLSPRCDASGLEQVVRDDLYYYYVLDGKLYRQPATTSGGPALLMTKRVGSVAALTIREGYLYYASYSSVSQTSIIYKLKADDTVEASPLTLATGEVTQLQSFVLRDGSTAQDALLWYTKEQRLARWKASTGNILTILNGQVNSFSIDTVGLGSLAFFTTYAFVARDGGLFRYDLADGEVKTLYIPDIPSAGRRTIRSVTTETTLAPAQAGAKNIYLTEELEICANLACSHFPVIYRHPLVADDFVQGWEPITIAENGGGGYNLRSDGQYLYYNQIDADPADDQPYDKIRRLRTNTPSVEVNVRADYLEVVQAIQSLDNAVDLVADRPTYARGYAQLVAGDTKLDAVQVEARLYGELIIAPGDLRQLGPIEPVNDPLIDGTAIGARRSSLATSFLFRLPDDWVQTGLSGIPAGLRLRMVINPNGLIPEPPGGAADNTVTLRNSGGSNIAVPIIHKVRPCLVTIPILALGVIPGNPPAVVAVAPEGEPSYLPDNVARARSMMPVEDFVVYPVFPYLLGETPYLDLNQAYFSDGGDPFYLTEDDTWVRWLLDLSDLTSDAPPGCVQTFYVGMIHETATWVNDDGGPVGGVSGDGDEIILVRVDPERGGDRLAHELGHSYGREHINCPIDGFPDDQDNFDLLPWPEQCDISFDNLNAPGTHFGFNHLAYAKGGSAVLTPTGPESDVMSYMYPKWISPNYWNTVLAEVPNAIGPSAALGPPALAADGPALLVQGSVAPDEGSASLARTIVLPAEAVPARHRAAQTAGPAHTGSDISYTLRLLDADGASLAEHSVIARRPFSHRRASATPREFSQYVPWHAAARRIQLLHAGQVLAERRLSAGPPTISLDPPAVDAARDTIRLSWTATDPDGDELRALVQYSADGARWQTLQSDLRRDTITLSSQLLPGGPQARVRVIVDDGVRSALALSAPFTLRNHAPRLTIGGLRDDQRLSVGQIALSGSALDPEDGVIEGLEWALSGPVDQTSRGDSLSLRDLPPGPYQVRLRATDSAGLVGELSRSFEVLPPAIPDGARPTLDGRCADSGYAQALEVRLPGSDGRPAPAYLLHADGALYACFSSLRYPAHSRAASFAGLRVDPDASGERTAQIGDIGFFVDSAGQIEETLGNGGVMPVTDLPQAGFSAEVARGAGAWSAELRIEDGLLGGWGHPARLSIAGSLGDPTLAGNSWPRGAGPSEPSSWAPVYLGSPPAPPNRAPVAQAASRSYSLSSAQAVSLDGAASSDPDGDPISYSWTQIGGPPVALQGAATATPYFSAGPVGATTQYRFRLTVSDGSRLSAPVEVTLTLLPPDSRHRIALPMLRG